MSNVIKLRPALDPDEVLRAAIGELTSVVVVGYDKDGDVDCRASLNLNHAEVLWLVESFKHNLINHDYYTED